MRLIFYNGWVDNEYNLFTLFEFSYDNKLSVVMDDGTIYNKSININVLNFDFIIYFDKGKNVWRDYK